MGNKKRIVCMEERIATKVAGITMAVNMILFIIKLIAGIAGNSEAMISDAIHTASDVFSTIIVIIGVKISMSESDRKHQYGHERFECVASLLLAVCLFLTGAGIGLNSIEKIMSGTDQGFEIPSIIALIAALVSIVVKEWMYWYTRAASRQINSGALMADAWHHRSDALSSVGALIGIAGAIMKFPVLDLIACLVISIFIGKAAFDIFKESVEKMLDCSCEEEVAEQMKKLAECQEGVLEVTNLKTRLFGAKIYVDVEVSADERLFLFQSQRIAQNIHDTIEENFPLVKHCMVYVKPGKATKEEIEKEKERKEEEEERNREFEEIGEVTQLNVET